MPIDKAPIDTGAMLIITDGARRMRSLTNPAAAGGQPLHHLRSRLNSAWARQSSAPVADLIG
jgi:hypothetical protein